MPPKVITKSSDLTQSKLDKIYKELGPVYRERLVEWHWEYIPSDAKSDYEKVCYILCAVPGLGSYSLSMSTYLLKFPPQYTNSKWYLFAKPAVAKEVIEILTEEQLTSLLELYAPHKHIPAKYKRNREFMLILMISECFDLAGIEFNSYASIARYLDVEFRKYMEDFLE